MGSTVGVRRCRRGVRSRNGAMLVLVAVALVILLATAAFSVDMAYMFLAREQLHVATDAATKAAVVGLSQGNTQQSAIDTAIQYAAANTVCGKSLTITSSNVSLGNVTYSQGGYWKFNSGGTPTTAAQVTAQVSLPLFFAPTLGTSTFSPTKTSTAAFVRNKWCLVLDRSASMSFDMSGTDWVYPAGWPTYPRGYDTKPAPVGSRWSNIQAAISVFLNALSTSPVENQIALVTFADSGSKDCTFSTNFAPINTALANYGKLPIYGGTNLSSGIQAAYSLFASTDDGTPWNKIIVVFSDGQWNEGSDPLTLVGQANSSGIVIHTVGLLSQSNNYTMQQLPARTGGQFLYANSGAALQKAFQTLALTIPVILTQ